MTKKRLRMYKHIKKEYYQIQQQIVELENALYSPRVQHLTGMPSAHGPSDATENMIDEHKKLIDRYRCIQAELAAEQLAIEEAIQVLGPVARMLIRAHYIDGMSWPDVADFIGYSERQTHRLHGAALIELGKE